MYGCYHIDNPRVTSKGEILDALSKRGFRIGTSKRSNNVLSNEFPGPGRQYFFNNTVRYFPNLFQKAKVDNTNSYLFIQIINNKIITMEILHVQPLVRSKKKVVFWVGLTAVAVVASLLSSLYLCLMIIIFWGSYLIQIFRHHVATRVKMFYTKVQWEDDIGYFGVYTTASLEDDRHLSSRVFVAEKVGRWQQGYLFKFNENIYKTKEKHAERLSPYEILTLLQIDNIAAYK